MSNKTRKKELLESWKDSEKAKARARFPLPDESLNLFFEHLEAAVMRSGCRHDTQLAQDIIDRMKLKDDQANALLDWCANNGGYCDCEIAGNSQQHWLENRLAT